MGVDVLATGCLHLDGVSYLAISAILIDVHENCALFSGQTPFTHYGRKHHHRPEQLERGLPFTEVVPAV